MTEAEWLHCTEPQKMLEFLRGKASDRKWRLFGCACCRRVWQLYDTLGQHVVEVAERLADSLATSSERRVAAASVRKRYGGDLFGYGPQAVISRSAQIAGISGSQYAALNHTDHIVGPQPNPDQPLAIHEQYREKVNKQLVIEWSAQSLLVLDIFGNLFRPIAVDPTWLTSTVVQLVSGIYGERTFDLLPILADALEEAGCTDLDVLNHCRQQREHVRGCWVVDLFLGKK